MCGAEVWQTPTREIKKILSTKMDVLRKSARKSRIEKIKDKHIKEIMVVKEKTDIIDIIERKSLQWYGHVKRMQEERLPKLIMEWIPGKRRKRGIPRKT
jgi:CTP:phosphocholine cytidylyltransferase-like protein